MEGLAMVALWVRALVYLAFVGGGWLVVLPATLLLLEAGAPWPSWNTTALVVVGAALAVAGAALASWAGYCLIQLGKGTPLPLDPPRRLVTHGPYRCVRNPQAVAMLLMVAGEVVAVRSGVLWLLLPATLAYLELLAGPWEERRLARDFGVAYTEYAGRVPKWVPRCGRLRSRGHDT